MELVGERSSHPTEANPPLDTTITGGRLYYAVALHNNYVSDLLIILMMMMLDHHRHYLTIAFRNINNVTVDLDVAAFAMLAVATTAAHIISTRKRHSSSGKESINIRSRSSASSLFYVDRDNKPVKKAPISNRDDDDDNDKLWHRASYILVMYDPPELFYEPKEWSHTTVLLWKSMFLDKKMMIPGGPLRSNDDSYVTCATRQLAQLGIDVTQPENCLHHLFTFASEQTKQWSDCMECVYRGGNKKLLKDSRIVKMSLEELKNKIMESETAFTGGTLQALKLYFQRQMDLRAKRRLLKGYSSSDLQRYYGLRRSSGGSSSQNSIVFRADEHDSERKDALDYTMKTDDGMAPRLLQSADVVLIGVSRAGKTPLSLLLSQTKGLKVANIPLVLELPPPQQLDTVDPKRVFCITQQADHLVQVRKNRLRRELKNSKNKSRLSYADSDYVRRDLDHAKAMAREHGYTIIDITDRAMEEAASLIMSKLRERFPNADFGDLA